ncbi:CMRF35-like molecule 1 [Sinocyclocheilus grahami]|uniref:CMRF35-like molecule 1 n=1 Tax=Sinocyclocheilus grahami TaxID=75366 RepID=UPI0007AD646F|nr:PREDICTED: CMRF35-like molecule 1 [Sinocyclocheilus grahami]
MKFICALWLWMLLSEFNSTTGEISSQGHSEGSITITCSHGWASTNIKYFCRDPCKDIKDILVKSDQSPRGRYTLKDSREGTFTVNITDLQESDSGIYWCGVERFGFDSFKKVRLTVFKANTGNMEEVTHQRTMETQTNPGTSVEMHLTIQRHSVFVSSTTKDSTLSLTSAGFVKASGPAGEKAGAEHTNSSSSAHIFPVPLYYMPYAAGGLAVMVIICAVGLVTVCQCRKRVKKSRCVIARSIYNSHHSEEADAVYQNAPDDGPYATIKKSSTKSKDESQSDPIYQNLHFNTTQGETIYGNL